MKELQEIYQSLKSGALNTRTAIDAIENLIDAKQAELPKIHTATVSNAWGDGGRKYEGITALKAALLHQTDYNQQCHSSLSEDDLKEWGNFAFICCGKRLSLLGRMEVFFA